MTATETLSAVIRERAELARSQADADTELDAELAAWEDNQVQQEAHAALRRIARAHLARRLRVLPDQLGPAEVIGFHLHAGYVGDRAISGDVRFNLGDGLRFHVNWSGSAYVHLLVDCAEDGCDTAVIGPAVDRLETLPRKLADPGERRCTNHDRPF